MTFARPSIPEADDASLRTYYKYLAANLKFPFGATWTREAGMGGISEQVTIHALGGVENDPSIDDKYGILCRVKMSRGKADLPLAEVDKVKGNPNDQLVDDYSYWFWNHH